ncbi:hypothetical protein CLV63_102194 [Murinocardiopsis flavida]|uniref:HTH luxR-type domain-containing protein n=1 Tax=Murinocardiopsis flavida TaxID=645275 RepID=A0A2P8DS82_9ACTN|nr:hypothetical protein CLV63_102194 [Murinocardiopsis flavida]
MTVVRGTDELFARSAHLFESAEDIACAANDLHTWAITRPARDADHGPPPQGTGGKRIRKLYRPGVLLDPATAHHVRNAARIGADVRITPDELNETIILDRRMAILAGDVTAGVRSYSVVTLPEVLQGIMSLFEAAWRGAAELAVYDARLDEIRQLAPSILDLLNSGCKDEVAARSLGLGLRTYRRRVAELMTALGASSRFQAGARARELGLV